MIITIVRPIANMVLLMRVINVTYVAHIINFINLINLINLMNIINLMITATYMHSMVHILYNMVLYENNQKQIQI